MDEAVEQLERVESTGEFLVLLGFICLLLLIQLALKVVPQIVSAVKGRQSSEKPPPGLADKINALFSGFEPVSFTKDGQPVYDLRSNRELREAIESLTGSVQTLSSSVDRISATVSEHSVALERQYEKDRRDIEEIFKPISKTMERLERLYETERSRHYPDHGTIDGV